MANNPVVYNFNTGLTIDPNGQPFYSGGDQKTPHPYMEQLANAGVAFGVAGAGIGTAVALEKMGVPVADYALAAVRTAEEYFPGQVLRTFQAGNFLSQFSSVARADTHITSETIGKMMELKDPFAEELFSRFGGTTEEKVAKEKAAIRHGIKVTKGKAWAGDTLLAEHAGFLRNVGQPRLSMGYSRAKSGLEIPLTKTKASERYQASFTNDIEYLDAKGVKRIESRYLMLADSKFDYAWNQARAYGSESVDRFNRLAQAPFEMPPFSHAYEKLSEFTNKKLGFNISPGVKSGPGLRMMKDLAIKWGLGATAVITAYQGVDWATRQAEVFDGTILGEGTSAALGTAWVKGNMLAASVADHAPGARAYQDWQEEVAPGSTSLHRLATYPLLGMLAGSIAAYGGHGIRRHQLVQEAMKSGAAVDRNQAFRIASEQLSKEVREWNPKRRLDRLGMKFEASKTGRVLSKIAGKITPTKFSAMLGATVGAAFVAPFIPGALVPENTKEELADIYSGRKEIAVKKGRWWEFGRTAYEGTKVSYYRPHWYPLMVSQAREKSVWGDEADLNPFTKFFKKELTYDLEKKHYYDRPYPITGTFGEDIPLVGPLIAATFGKIMKPPKLMHTDEWMTGEGPFREGSSPTLRMPPREGEEYSLGMGEALPGTPANPYSLTKLLGEQVYREQEKAGLLGFLGGSTKTAITGSEGFADQEEILQSARRMFGVERNYWDRDLGGGMGTTELVRRLFPHRRREIPEYNPIRNTMPDWLPGPGDRSPDFQHGDPFTQVTMGDVRLPGAGYEALHPELEGLTPDQYPLIHKYKILADVAPYSEKTKMMGFQVKSALKRKELGPETTGQFKLINERMQERKQNKEFHEYKYLTDTPDMTVPGANQNKELLAGINRQLAEKKRRDTPGGIGAVAGTWWESLIKLSYSPFEFATPIAPAHKLMALRSPIESYEDTQLYGGESAFWQHPIDHFLKPFASTTAHSFMGYDGVPDRIQKKRDIQEYFDILEYTKSKRLEEAAFQEKDFRRSAEYAKKSEETLTGLNPYAFNFQNIYRALPREERDYFKSFAVAESKEDRERILEMVPDNEKRLYLARWTMNYVQELRNTLKNPEIGEDQYNMINSEIQTQLQAAPTEGYPVNEELHKRYMDEGEGSESYPDWYRRAIYIPSKLTESGIPGPDWVGWHPNVELDDLKMKMVDHLGLDMYTYDLWQSDKRRVAAKEFLDDDNVVSEMVNSDRNKSPEEISSEMRKLMADLDIPRSAILVTGVTADKQSVAISLDVTENRTKELRKRLNERE